MGVLLSVQQITEALRIVITLYTCGCGCVCDCVWGGEKGEVGKEKGEKETV